MSRDRHSAKSRAWRGSASGEAQRHMSRLSRETLGHIAVYGVVGALLTLALQLVEYRWLICQPSAWDATAG